MSLQDRYRAQGAVLADDGIPLHFGDVAAEYGVALSGVVVFDRSHEGRIALTGKDRFNLINRMSTNDMLNMPPHTARPTIFTNANARILDRVVMVNWQDDRALLLTGPGRNAPVGNYISKNIFFGDDVKLENCIQTTRQFALHGIQADEIMARWLPDVATKPIFTGVHIQINDADAFALRVKPLAGAAWILVAAADHALAVWDGLIEAGVTPAGGIAYNALRIRAGRPYVGRELTEKYIPLELGLWDEVSFSKGCYTGQEIIARMESRNQLAKMLIQLDAEQAIAPDTELLHNDKRVGTVTSSITAPDGTVYVMAVIKTAAATPGTLLKTADGASATVGDVLGVQR